MIIFYASSFEIYIYLLKINILILRFIGEFTLKYNWLIIFMH